MKKLFTIAALGLALSAPVESFANEGFSVFGVNLPIVKNEVSDSIGSNNLYTNEKDSLNVFGVDVKGANRKVSNTNTVYTFEDEQQDKDYIVVFGVRIPTVKS